MAREILFKAKRTLDGKWIEGYFVGEYLGGKIYLPDGADEEGFDRYDIDTDTLCQYTGLIDNNGDKIWENDIVGFEDVIGYDNGYTEHYCRGQVTWDEETVSFQVTERLSCESYEALMKCDVIGNVFDNPELLEVMS